MASVSSQTPTLPASPSSSPWLARLLCLPLFAAYALLLVLALGARPTVSDGTLWSAWLFVMVLSPFAAVCGVLLLVSRVLKDRAHRSIVDLWLIGLTTLALAVRFLGTAFF